MASTFGERLRESFSEFGQLCVGIDPHASLLESWGLPDSAKGLRDFALAVVQAASGRIGVIKPQVSFFERFGAAGFEVLADVTQAAHSAGLLVIADAKRGDIGTTMDAYLEAWFGDKSGLYADALTVSPYLGLGTIASGFDKWEAKGKGVYSLVATSNPEGESVQLARVGNLTLSGSQWEQLSRLNQTAALGSFGAVLGATLDLGKFGIDYEALSTPILAPGFGAQGAKLAEARKIFGPLSKNVAYSVSRSILKNGSEGLVDSIMEAKTELESGLSK